MKKLSFVLAFAIVVMLTAIVTKTAVSGSSTHSSSKMISAIQVEIFSAQLPNRPGRTKDPSETREWIIADLQAKVNNALSKHESVTVQWLQHSAACKYGSFTQLTAIVSY